MAITVNLEAFQGPLDLLLHLIDKNKVSIYDIPIAEITAQYLAYVRSMQDEDMEVTSEFMVMAAELIDIKCRMLLPKDPEAEEDEEDPREELVRRLLEYKLYKTISEDLRDLYDDENVVERDPDFPKEVLSWRPRSTPEELLSGITVTGLRAIFEDVMRRNEALAEKQRTDFGEVSRENVRLADTARELAVFAKKNRTFSFRKLLSGQKTRMRTIVMFLAVLEFMKAGYVRTTQNALFDDIEIETVEGADLDHIEIDEEIME